MGLRCGWRGGWMEVWDGWKWSYSQCMDEFPRGQIFLEILCSSFPNRLTMKDK